MNTTQVGQAFEKDVLAFFEQLIRDGQFGMIPSGCKVYHQKGYYSRERESNIVFDIAIEVFLPGAAQYIFRFLIECKKYKHAVPVNDIEEFMGKVRQVILSAKVLVAELTTRNPNVFYELGLAHALEKPVVLVSSREEDVPFDLQHIRVIYYDMSDPFWGTKLIEKVAENILSAIQNPEEAVFRRKAES